MAEHAGKMRAFGLQRLLYQAVWDEDSALEAVRSFAVRHLAAPGAVLVFDEKKGTATAGVGRQCRRRGVLRLRQRARTLSSRRRLYVQEHWTKDPQ
jgi:hypothetical protein